MNAKKVKISKVGQVEDALYEAPSFNEYEMGKYNGDITLPIEYWLEGFLNDDEPTVGKSVVVLRTSRNGVQMGGLFSSSTVTEVTDDGFKTLNSVYKLEYI
jgi:hypothetical protein